MAYARTKTFNGVQYHAIGGRMNKKNALKKAKDLRSQGFRARVVNVQPEKRRIAGIKVDSFIVYTAKTSKSGNFPASVNKKGRKRK